MASLSRFRPLTPLLWCLVAIVCLSWSSHVAAQAVDPELWGTDRSVHAVARNGNTVYIGGVFNAVGPSTGGGVPLDDQQGDLLRPFPRVAGTVYAAVSDGEGGWFVGGDFVSIEGVPRWCLAHILADGSLAPWDLRPNGVILSMALRGTTLYVGGGFTFIGSQERPCLAALHTRTGEALPFAPRPNRAVESMVLSGRTLYIGGDFTTIGERTRNYIAAVDAVSGELTDWNPDAEYRVLALSVRARTIFAGGYFIRIGGQSRKYVAALDMDSGKATSWDAQLGPDRWYGPHGDRYLPYVAELAEGGRTIYAGGSFSTAGGEGRNSLAALDAVTGDVTAWDARLAGGEIAAMALRGHTLYVGGLISTIGGQTRINVAGVDTRTGLATDWDPRAHGAVYALAPGDGSVYAGGSFWSMREWQWRHCLAALDARSGAALPWDPGLQGPNVGTLALVEDKLWVGGNFTGFNGQARSNLAAFNAATGTLESCAPDPDGGVSVLLGHEGLLYAGGGYTRIGGFARSSLAALEPLTGSVTDWHPDLGRGPLVNALAAIGDTIYVGGDIHVRAGSDQFNALAAFDAATGTVTRWYPAPRGYRSLKINTMLAVELDLAIGGQFRYIGGQERWNLALVDPMGAQAANWRPDPRDTTSVYEGVHAVASSGSTLFVGGNFTSIAEQARTALAATDVTSGALSDWDPKPTLRSNKLEPVVGALAVFGDELYVAGNFRAISGFPQAGLTRYRLMRPSPAATRGPDSQSPARAFAEMSCGPSPTRGAATIRFTFTDAATVSLTVFDLQGRRIRTLLDGAWEERGTHDVAVRAQDWSPGVYLCRLEAAGRSMTRKLLVVE